MHKAHPLSRWIGTYTAPDSVVPFSRISRGMESYPVRLFSTLDDRYKVQSLTRGIDHECRTKLRRLTFRFFRNTGWRGRWRFACSNVSRRMFRDKKRTTYCSSDVSIPELELHFPIFSSTQDFRGKISRDRSVPLIDAAVGHGNNHFALPSE